MVGEFQPRKNTPKIISLGQNQAATLELTS
jgi:hypothetical protein